MTEFWESSFLEKQTMWGFEPSDSAILTKDFFLEMKVKDILIPGIGYGRNAKIFYDNGINKTAIDLARQNRLDIRIYHGSVTDMPFDSQKREAADTHRLGSFLSFEVVLGGKIADR